MATYQDKEINNEHHKENINSAIKKRNYVTQEISNDSGSIGSGTQPKTNEKVNQLPPSSKASFTTMSIIAFFVFVDVLGFALILPLLPHIVDGVGKGVASAAVVGVVVVQVVGVGKGVGAMMAGNAIGQGMTSAVLGSLSDRVGRRPVLLCCSLLTCFSFLLLLFSHSLLLHQFYLLNHFHLPHNHLHHHQHVDNSNNTMDTSPYLLFPKSIANLFYSPSSLKQIDISKGVSIFSLVGFQLMFLSRIMDGLFGGNVHLAQAAIADLANGDSVAQERGMGLIGAAFGLAFVFGPITGALLVSTESPYSVFYPTVVAFALSVINLFAMLFFLPETNVERSSTSRNFVSDLRSLFAACKNRTLFPLLVLRFNCSFIFTLFESTFTLFCKSALLYSVKEGNYLLAFVGLIYALTQGAIGRVARKQKLLLTSSPLHFNFHKFIVNFAIVGLTLLLFCLQRNNMLTGANYLLLALFSVGIGILNCYINVSISQCASKEHVGGYMGLSASIGSLTRMLAPLFGSFLFELHVSLPFLFAFSLAVVTVLFLLVNNNIDNNDNKGSKKRQ